jgi:hypothetical protein
MLYYRFLYLNGRSEPVSEQRLQAAHDEDAMDIARLLSHRLIIEVWQGQTRIGVTLPRRKAP